MDVVARYGGEEFAVILPQTEKDEANIIAERIRKEVERTYYPMEETQPGGEFTISLGLAAYTDDASELLELINNADKAMYAAKAQGKNRVVTFSREFLNNQNTNSNPLNNKDHSTNAFHVELSLKEPRGGYNREIP
jgi:predicted signal transduction protein with EAL and GGDEF domain